MRRALHRCIVSPAPVSCKLKRKAAARPAGERYRVGSAHLPASQDGDRHRSNTSRGTRCAGDRAAKRRLQTTTTVTAAIKPSVGVCTRSSSQNRQVAAGATVPLHPEPCPTRACSPALPVCPRPLSALLGRAAAQIVAGLCLGHRANAARCVLRVRVHAGLRQALAARRVVRRLHLRDRVAHDAAGACGRQRATAQRGVSEGGQRGSQVRVRQALGSRQPAGRSGAGRGCAQRWRGFKSQSVRTQECKCAQVRKAGARAHARVRTAGASPSHQISARTHRPTCRAARRSG